MSNNQNKLTPTTPQFLPRSLQLLRILTCLLLLLGGPAYSEEGYKRPNILFAIADDWGWPHAGGYGDPVVKTPAFDRVAEEGVLFNHAYVSAPSCTPSRGAILTGQWHWRLGGAANLHSVWPDRFATYPETLKEAGYSVGYVGKGWGPGRTETQGREIVGKRFKSFDEFIAQREEGQPFCFWLGGKDPHRPYDAGTGEADGMDLSAIELPGCFPDTREVRSDVADYYFEVQRFDAWVGRVIAKIEEIGELDNTLVVITGDHGMPFPRSKSNLYDTGARVPLAIRWPVVKNSSRVVDDFVSLTDLAPTFLQAAGIDVPQEMSGRSLLYILTVSGSGRIEEDRDFILVGKERHVPSQTAPDMGGYPCRSIRTDDMLYIWNIEPDRLPAGTPDYKNAAIPGAWLADCDNGPTKTAIVAGKENGPEGRKYYDLSFGKRPAEELYDLKKDPDQLNNIAGDPEYIDIQKALSSKLKRLLKESGDPRVVGGGEKFDEYPYLGGAPKHPLWKQAK